MNKDTLVLEIPILGTPLVMWLTPHNLITVDKANDPKWEGRHVYTPSQSTRRNSVLNWDLDGEVQGFMFNLNFIF